MTSLLDSLPLGFTLSDNEISLKNKKKKEEDSGSCLEYLDWAVRGSHESYSIHNGQELTVNGHFS